MRILYSHRIQSRDGQSVHVEEMVAALRAAGHEVLVVGPGFYERAGFGGGSALVAGLRRMLPGALAELAELAYSLPAWLRLRRACREFRPDMIYERYNLFYLAGALAAHGAGVPFYVEVNAPLAEERASHGRLRLRRLARWSERRVWRAADRVLAVTGVLGAMIAAAGVPAERIGITPNGADPARFRSRPLPVAHTAPVLGFVGFVREWHGLDAVLEALAAQRPGEPLLSLVVAGEGPATMALRAQAAGLGIARRVRFLGLVPPERLPEVLAGVDIALQPKSVAYASPLKIFDYMAAGCAIVAPDQPNLREILEHGRTALLFDPTDPAAMWREVRRLAADAGLRRRLGAAARAKLVGRDWTWAGNARRVTAWAEADLRRRVPSANLTHSTATGT